MDALVKSLIELNELADGRAFINPLGLEYDLRARHGGDSRVPLLVSAASLNVPQQLTFECEPGLLRKRLSSARGYSDEATAFAVGAWAAACHLVDIAVIPPLAEAPKDSLAERYKKSLAEAATTLRRVCRHRRQSDRNVAA